MRRNVMKYKCKVCGHIYDENMEGKKFEELPDNWTCPLCGVGKEMFEKMKESDSFIPNSTSKNNFFNRFKKIFQ